MTQDEEPTYSEEIIKPKSWKEWAKENKNFLMAIAVLFSISLILFIENQIPSKGSLKEEILLTPSLQTKPTPASQKKKIPPPSPLDPLLKAETLFKRGELEQALHLLLEVSQTHPDANTREKAGEKAKVLHEIKERREKNRKKYLEGYVLFAQYPQEACKRWEETLRHPEDNGPYEHKAKKRFQQDCQTYSNTN